MGNLSILQSLQGLATKTWKKDGTISDFNAGKMFATKEAKIRSISGMYKFLDVFQHKADCFVIRGKFMGENPDNTTRRKVAFADQPLNLFCIDIDGFTPLAADPVLHPELAIEDYLSKVFEDGSFSDVSYVWQLSSSAGSKKNEGVLKAHVWFWSSEEYTSAQMRVWAKGINAKHPRSVDAAVFQQIQAHYTATPMFEDGAVDPVPLRCGFVQRGSDEVVLDMSPNALSAEMPKAFEHNGEFSLDSTAQFLFDSGLVLQEDNGKLHITCPFEEEHTTASSVSSTSYLLPTTDKATGTRMEGHYKCQHDGCTSRGDEAFSFALGMPGSDPMDDFEVITEAPKEQTKPRFTVVPAHEFIKGKPASWIVKNVLPQGELGVVFGDSGSGKTFFILDMVSSVAQGVEWRGNKVKQKNVVYIAAEDSAGVRNRLKAASIDSGTPISSLPIGIIGDAPNFMEASHVKDVILALHGYGDVGLVIVDTFAQVMVGANENAGEDVGKALKHCREIHKHTGAMVVLIHHAGKDSSKGARGWSGLRAASDVEIEVNRADEARSATVTKLKNGQDGATFGFKLNTIQVDFDEDGDPITSCIVEYVDGAKKVVPKVKPKGGRMTLADEYEAKVMNTLEDLGGVTERMKYEELRKTISGQYPEGSKVESAVGAAITRLITKGLAVLDDGWVNIVR